MTENAIKGAIGQGRNAPPISRAFLRDLRFVFETDASDDVPLAALRTLEIDMTKWGKSCRNAIRREFSKFPEHPANCPISLYGAMGLGRLEVAHTRTLAWLLDPKREHGFRDTLLQALWRHVRNSDEVLRLGVKNVHVERFHRNIDEDGAGRTDIWIEGSWTEPNSKPWLIVIEAKIDSPLGSRQLERYDKEIDTWREDHNVRRKDVHRILLTTHHTLPDGTGKDWIPLSFVELARLFVTTSQSLRHEAGYEFFRLYLAGVLKNILDLPIGRDKVQKDPYRLLEFLRKSNTTT